MTREQRHSQQEMIRRLKAQGNSVCAIAKMLDVSHSQVQRALMTEDQRIQCSVKAQMRKDRLEKSTPWGRDRLFKRLYQVFGQPRNDVAKELQGTRFA